MTGCSRPLPPPARISARGTSAGESSLASFTVRAGGVLPLKRPEVARFDDHAETLSNVSPAGQNSIGSFGPHVVDPSFPGFPPLVVEYASKSTPTRRDGSGSSAGVAYASPRFVFASVSPVDRSFSVKNLRIEPKKSWQGAPWCELSRHPVSPKSASRPDLAVAFGLADDPGTVEDALAAALVAEALDVLDARHSQGMP